MTPEKTITLNGQEVKMIYCAATENGFEQISQNNISVFVPTFGKNDQGEDIIVEPAKATIGDIVTLAVAAIVAAHSRDNQEPPVKSEYILYESTPQERNELISAIVELRHQWYAVPQSVADTIKKESNGAHDEGAKN